MTKPLEIIVAVENSAVENEGSHKSTDLSIRKCTREQDTSPKQAAPLERFHSSSHDVEQRNLSNDNVNQFKERKSPVNDAEITVGNKVSFVGCLLLNFVAIA